MFGSVLSAIGAIQTILSLLTLGYLLFCAWRPSRKSGDNDERGMMRSMSWPAA